MLDDSYVIGILVSGSGVKVDVEIVFNNMMFKGISIDGIGVEIIVNLLGYYGSLV